LFCSLPIAGGVQQLSFQTGSWQQYSALQCRNEQANQHRFELVGCRKNPWGAVQVLVTMYQVWQTLHIIHASALLFLAELDLWQASRAAPV
jgi:hypothetical protein